MLCEVADERQQTLDLGDAPAPERKPRARRTFCPRCGRGPLTGSTCGWCRGRSTGRLASKPECMESGESRKHG